MKLDYHRLNAKVSKGEISNFYYFYGEEIFLQEEIIRKIESVLKISDFNKKIFYGFDFNLEEFTEFISSPTFFGDKKIIILKYLNNLSKIICEEILKMIKQANDYVILSSYEKKPIRSPLTEFVEENGCVVEFRTLTRGETKEWIRNYLKKDEIKIDEKAIDFMLEKVGTMLLPIKNELEKLKLYVGKSKIITLQNIEDLYGYTKKEGVFSIEDNLLKMDTKKTLLTFENLIAYGEEPTFILSRIYSLFGKLIFLKSFYENSTDINIAFSRLNIPEFKKDDFLKFLNRYGREELISILEKIYYLDLDIKKGHDPISGIELLILEILNR